jgi:hypothetical protein
MFSLIMRIGMQLAFCLSVVALVASGPALADPWDITVFVPSREGINAYTLNLETQKIQKVLEGSPGMPPPVCPPEAYWAVKSGHLVSCADGTLFDLKETSKVGVLGAFAVIPRP